MRTTSLTLALVLVACGDDAVPNVDGTTDAEGTATEPTTTTGVSTSSATGITMTTQQPSTTSEDSSSSSAESDSTTMEPGPACGDGNEDPDEECDDGNLDQDDACTAMCTIPFVDEWTVSYNGPASNADSAIQVIFDGAGNILVVGRHRTVSDGFDLWLQQYGADGTEMWNFTWDGGVTLNDGGNGVALHPSGDVIIVGYTEPVLDDDDIVVMRVPFGGDTPTWVMPYDGPGSGMEDFDNGDYANAVMVDGNGDIVVAGNERVDGERGNVWLRKYDPDGGEIWLQTYNGAQSENDSCNAMTIDAADNIYVACITEEVQDVSTGWIRKYDSAGAEVWTEEVAWLPNGITLDSDENIILTGFADGGTLDIIVNKYDPAFTEIWSQTVNGPSAGGDFGRNVTTDADGNVYVVGTVAVTGQQDNIYAHKFDVDGADLWAHAYNNEEAGLSDYGQDVAVDGDGSVYIVGSETVLGQQSNAWIRKLVQQRGG